MGSSLSAFSPSNPKAGKYNFLQNSETVSATRSMISQHLHFLNGSTLKKLISSSTRKSSRIVLKPVEIIAPEIPCPKPEETLPQKIVKKTVLQASTSELLRCLGIFLHARFHNLSGEFSPYDPVIWLRGIDRNLIAQGWQDVGFINPANIVFLYVLLRGMRAEQVKTLRQLQGQVLAALYLSYCYMGHEISYPVRLFLYADDNKDDFWKRTLRIIDLHSESMLRLNSDSAFFAKIFAELKSFGAPKPVQYSF